MFIYCEAHIVHVFVSVLLETDCFSVNSTQERGSGSGCGSALGNYEAYKPPTGAMGDRMAAMKQAFQVTSIYLLLLYIFVCVL